MKSPFFFFVFFSIFWFSKAQTIEAPRGYAPQVGTMVSMLDDLKFRITQTVASLSQEETDFLLDADANRIGAMIMHLAATEVYYQLYTFEGRQMNAAEQEKWSAAMHLGDEGRGVLKGKPIGYYLAE